jgi:transposase
MNIFFQELEQQYRQQPIILVMDGASWHKSRSLNFPENIEIVYLPLYSPELNFVERLWNYIKASAIRNKTYLSLEYLKDVICSFVASLERSILKSLCSCAYLFN